MKQLKHNQRMYTVLAGIMKKLLPVILAFATMHVHAKGWQTVCTPWEFVYGEKFSVLCLSQIALGYSKDSLSFRPMIMVNFVYNSSPGGEKCFAGDRFVIKDTIPVKGKKTFRLTAIDNQKRRDYNSWNGKYIGVLAEKGKYLAVKTKLKYDGSKPKSERLKAKYKIKLIDEKDFPDFSYRNEDF